MPSRFKPNRNFAKELKSEPDYVQGLVSAAESAASAARSIAAVDAFDDGDYHDGIEVIVQDGKVYVAGTDWKSHWIEWGSANNPPSAPLRRGARAAGLTLREASK